MILVFFNKEILKILKYVMGSVLNFKSWHTRQFSILLKNIFLLWKIKKTKKYVMGFCRKTFNFQHIKNLQIETIKCQF